MNYDVYLGGASTSQWREEFKTQISSDISIFDPLLDEYQDLSEEAKANETARQLFHLENGNTLIVFYLDFNWNGTSSLLELGDSVGRGKQVIVCLDGEVMGEDKIRRYCEFRGVMIVESIEELVAMTESYLAEKELCAVKI